MLYKICGKEVTTWHDAVRIIHIACSWLNSMPAALSVLGNVGAIPGRLQPNSLEQGVCYTQSHCIARAAERGRQPAEVGI